VVLGRTLRPAAAPAAAVARTARPGSLEPPRRPAGIILRDPRRAHRHGALSNTAPTHHGP
jgi:hypothetical protein